MVIESENTSDDTLFYRAFEDKHRGSRGLIKTRLQQYLPFLEPLAELHPLGLVLDLGCGRGEWLEVASEAGLSARGIDLDPGMLAACTERGLHVEQQDAIQALQAQPDASVCAVSAFHVVEHITFNVLQTLVREALRALIPGGLLILETPNPENLVVGTTNFYLDPTHIRPIPPLLLEFLPDHYGYIRHKTLRLQESASLRETNDLRLLEILSGVSPDYAVVAQKAAPSEVLQAFDTAFRQNYGVTLGDLSERYENTQRQRQEKLNARITDIQTHEQVLREQVIPQLQQSQMDKLTLQQELLDRERAFTAQLSAMHAQHQQAQESLNQPRDARESELKRELIALQQAMEALRDTAQHREQDLQQSLLDRERTFTAQLSAMHAQHQQAIEALNQTHAAHESELRKVFNNSTETMLTQVRAEAVAQVQIYQRLVAQLHAQENTQRNELAQHAAYAHALAIRVTAMQSTWWWRLSMLWRRASLWSAVSSPAPLPAGFHAQADQLAHAAATMPPQTAQASIPTAVVPQAACASTDGNEHLDLDLPEQNGLAMPIQNITELFSLDGRAFITEAYRNLLGREPDPHGMAYYLGRLAMGYGKASVITDLAQSAESRPHREIIGLDKLIVTERRANHWLWGRFSGRQHQKNLLREGFIQGLAHIAALMENLTEHMEDHRTFAISNQSYAATKEQYLLSPDDVRAAYREILGREPENDQVITHHAKCESTDALRQSLLESEEFQYRINMKHLVPANVSQVGGGVSGEVETLDPRAREIYLELVSRLLINPKRSLGEV
ncbi:MAG: methyltransferase domain-containing protein [Acidithiobacillus ferriphilus]